jgi:hypothetical protein
LTPAIACNHRPARDAIDETEQALAAARPQLESYAPQDLAALRVALRQARAELGEGRYTDALRLAQRLPGRIRAAVEKATRRKGELVADWAELSGELPAVQRGIAAKLDELSQRMAPARGLDGDTLTAARTELVDLTEAWSRATAAFGSGQVSRALEDGREVKARTDALAARLGLTPAPRP